MNKISTVEIKELVSKFSKKTLPRNEWRHDTHLIMGLWHIMNKDFDSALDSMRSKIKAYNISVGTLNTDEHGYHESLTIFWMVIIKSFLLKHPTLQIEEAVHLFSQSEVASQDHPLKYYTKEVLLSIKARKNWVNGNLKKISMTSTDYEMTSHYEFSDSQFEREFNDCTFPPSLFNHEAHLRLAWINIKQYGIQQAEKNIQKQLLNFVAFVGAKDKYHATLTVAAIRAIDHFIKRSSFDTFKDFILQCPELKNDFKSLIESHYSYDVFNSAEAKGKFLEPDLHSFV